MNDMAKCVNCGEELKESEAVCPVCGTLVLREENKEDEQSEKPAENTPVKEKDDRTDEYDPADIAQNKTKSVLCYVWVFVLIAVFDAKDSDFVRFHRRQGLILLAAETLYAVNVYLTLSFLRMALPNILVVLAGAVLYAGFALFIVLMIKGIKAAARGKAKELPVIGRLAERMRAK